MILNILSIIFSCIALLIAVISANHYRCLVKIPEKNKSDNTEQEEINLTEKLHSLEFNTRLDDLIRPMLGKYTNKEIVEKLTSYITTYDMKITDESEINMIRNYLSDLLLIYNNHIEEEPEDEKVSDDSQAEYFEIDPKKMMTKNDDISIIDVALRDFYK